MTDTKSKLRLVTGADVEQVQSDPFVGRTLSKNYTLLKVLGEGGMGKVYLAVNEGLGRRVAIKVLLANRVKSVGGTIAVDRFNREAEVAAQIESPHVVGVTDHFSDDVGNHFIVMEYVDGPDMESILEKDGLFSLDRLLPLVRQIGRGMSAAHKLGIVHRDLKCENVIVIRMDDEGEFAKITDFGIAKISDAGAGASIGRKLTQENVICLGTPHYMSPEQALNKVEVDKRTDVYAFGVLVYHALTGEYPVDGRSLTEILSRLMSAEDTAMPIAVHRPEHAHLWPVLSRALAKNRDERYDDIRSFVDALEDAAGVPRLSRPSGMRDAAAIGHAPTLDVTGARKAPKHDKEAATLDAAAPAPQSSSARPQPGAARPEQAQAPSLRTLAIGLGALLTVAVGTAYVITSGAPSREPAPVTEEPAAVASDPEPETVPEPVRPVVRTPRVAPVRVPEPPVPSRVEAPPRGSPAERGVEAPIVRTAPVAPVPSHVEGPVAPRLPAVAPTMELPAVCQAALRRRGRGAGRAECLQYHATVCGGSSRTPWCDLIEATLHLPRAR